MPKEKQRLSSLKSHLLKGDSISQALRKTGFNDFEETIIYFSEFHGDFLDAFQIIEDRLSDQVSRRKRLVRLLGYPLMLVIFLFGIILAIRTIILPTTGVVTAAKNDNLGVLLIRYGPEFIGCVGILFSVVLLLGTFFTRKLRQIDRLILISKLPIIKSFLQITMTAFLANQMGKLLSKGLGMKDILEVMSNSEASKFSQEISERIVGFYQKGMSFGDAVGALPFLRKEFKQIIIKGELQGKLGAELILYSQLLWQDLDDRVERIFLWLQPLVFCGIALIILAVYGALLLPIYQEMEGIV